MPPKPAPRKIQKIEEATEENDKCIQNNAQEYVKHRDVFQKLGSFRAARKYTDFTIKVHEKEFAVHKNILAAQSHVFDEMFSNKTNQNTKAFNKIKNLNLCENLFEHFLDYFYTGHVNSEANLLDLFELASEFEVCNQAGCDHLHQDYG